MTILLLIPSDWIDPPPDRLDPWPEDSGLLSDERIDSLDPLGPGRSDFDVGVLLLCVGFRLGPRSTTGDGQDALAD